MVVVVVAVVDILHAVEEKRKERGARGEMKGLAPKSRRSGICRRAREEGSHRVK